LAQKKEEDIIASTISQVRYAWRHRKGNETVGLILDTFDNLGLVTKDNRQPVKCGQKKTDYGWHLVFNLPPGISFAQIKRKQEYFSDAIKGWVDITKKDGYCHMDLQCNHLPEKVDFSWDPNKYGNTDLPVPIGVTQKGIEVLDLAKAPHLLVAGIPGFGKSNFLHVLVASLIGIARICIIDLKRLEFSYLNGQVLLAKKEKDAIKLLEELNKEHDRRVEILEKAGAVKVQDYSGEMPFIVVVVDEVAELQSDIARDYLNRILRLSRACGISVVAATQRPSVKVIDGDTRGQFSARLCYLVADETNSRMVLGEECSRAAWLQPIKGRAIYKFGHEVKEVQTMFLPLKQAKELARNREGRDWDFEPGTKRLLPR
jgi:S-DNA-T family DNA segregation ATPase FtsK/SpoIIIE